MTAKRLQRPRDPVQQGKVVGNILTGQVEDRQAAPEKRKVDTVEVARKGGLNGVKARAGIALKATLIPSTPQRRLLSARI